MRIYLAAAYGDKDLMKLWRYQLRKISMVVTSTWLDQEEIASGYMETLIAHRDLEEIDSSDILVHYANPARRDRWRGGCQVEFGYALACRKKLVVIGEQQMVFHHCVNVRFFESFTSFLGALFKEEV